MIGRNFIWLSLARMSGLIVGLFAGIYARRVLGADAIGQYSWCLAVLSYFTVLTNPGLDIIAQRDVAREPAMAAQRFSQLLALQSSLALAAFGLLAILSLSQVRGPMVSNLLMLSAIALLLMPFNLAWLLHAHERMAAPALAQTITQFLRLPALIWLVREPAHVNRYVLLAYPFQVVVICYLGWYVTRYRLLHWMDVRPTFRGVSLLMKEALPVGLSQGATHLYYNFDAVLLGVLTSDETVGVYVTAYGVMLIPTFLSAALTAAFFPPLSRLQGDVKQSARMSSLFLWMHMWLALPFAALGWGFGRHVIDLLYGSPFVQSGPLLEWLSLNLVLIFFSTGIGQPMNAWGLQKNYFKIVASGAMLNVVLNLALIPYLGVWGAVVTTLLAEGFVGIGCLWIRRSHVPIRWWAIAAKPVAICASAAVIGRYLVFIYPNSWWLILLAVAFSILGTFYLIERRIIRDFLHDWRNMNGSRA